MDVAYPLRSARGNKHAEHVMKRDSILDVQNRLRACAESLGITEAEMGVIVGGSDWFSPIDASIHVESCSLLATGSIEQVEDILNIASSVEDVARECRARGLCSTI